MAALVVLTTPVAAQDWKGHARLDGHVTGPSGAPLSGATITIENLTLEGGLVVTSDAEGAWATVESGLARQLHEAALQREECSEI